MLYISIIQANTRFIKHNFVSFILKRNIMSRYFILFVLSSILTIHAYGQADSTANIKKSVVTLYNGEQIIGKIISDDGREILIVSEKIGKIYIAKSDIKEITDLENTAKKMEGGDYILEGPFTTRYSFTTNALPIKKNVNYAMLNLYGPEIHFAVTNKLSLGIMSTWLGSPIALVAKYTLKTKNEKLNFAIGGIMGSSGYFNKARGYGGLGWLTVTYGNRIDNISFSGGYGFIGNSNSNLNPFTGGPLFSIAGITKVGKKSSVIFDSMLSFTQRKREITNNYYDGNGNYYYNTEIVKENNIAFFLMPGFRFQSTENKAFQVSLAGVIDLRGSETFSFPLPMCSWFFKL